MQFFLLNRRLNINQIRNGSRNAQLGPQALFTNRKEGFVFLDIFIGTTPSLGVIFVGALKDI